MAEVAESQRGAGQQPARLRRRGERLTVHFDQREVLMSRFLVIAALLANSFTVNAQTAETVGAPSVKEGDSWTYVRSDKMDRTRAAKYTTTVKSVSADGYVTAVEPLEGSMTAREDRYNKDGNLVDFEGFKFQPFVGIYEFPLSAGKQWESKYTWFSPTANAQLSGTRRNKVAGWETVKTPAGEFKALKITAETQIMGRSGFGSSTQATYWYAPDVRRLVRVETKGFGAAARDEVVELVSYKLAQ
jgi:hypothetical protein